MAISAAQYTVTTSSGKLCAIPPGPCMVVISNAGTTAADVVWVGTGPHAVSALNGAPVPAGKSVPLTFPPGSAAGMLEAIGAVQTLVGVLISQPGGVPSPSSGTAAGPVPEGISAPGLAVPGEMIPGSPG